ncbi:MAG: acyl-ACP--UDP-N-acetylglucosamine O-acyltransferase [Candidatus Methylacidiphilales bacterium]|nr:acyl-ACP--UDP-N-acetylglucosamine O-acyltransferase [Candidatus Methylacidiphilales bacterium]
MSSLIHPNAYVHPEAQLGNNVKVGPGATIDAGCIIGDDCEIRNNAVITGGTIMGQGNQIGYCAIIGSEPQDRSFTGQPSHVEIGNRNIIREHVTIHRGAKPGAVTRLGDDCFLMTGCHMAHDTRVGSRVTMVNNVLLAGYVEVRDGAFLGGASVIHQHVRVGELAIMRGQTRISKDVPPYFMAADTNLMTGLNRVGMRRAGLSAASIRVVQHAYHILFAEGRNVTQSLEELQKELGHEPEVRQIIDFISTSKRGICRGVSKRGVKDENEFTG